MTEESGELNTYYLKYELKGTDGSIKEGRIGTLSRFNINQYLEAGGSVTYELRLWLDKDTPNSEQGNSYQSKVAVEGRQIQKSFIMPETPMKEYINSEEVEFNEDTKNKMFIYHHKAGAQQENWTEEELTDYRYIGANPNNYVTFNGEEAGWRIIGIFTVENEQGEKEQRIKLVRKDIIGNYSWDINDVNDWTNSSLMKEINPNTGSTTFNLTEEALSMIGDIKWHLGGYSTFMQTASEFYIHEHSKEVYQERPTFWIGEVGLVYPSDYGYATSDSSCLFKCLSEYILSPCYTNDWLFNGFYQWTITPNSIQPNYVFYIRFDGAVYDATLTWAGRGVRPVVYLSSNVKLDHGSGTEQDPFVFTK